MTPDFWLKVVLLLLPLSALAEVKERYCDRRWFGTAPFCGGHCDDGWDEVVNSDITPAYFGRDKSWCGDPVPGLTVHCQGWYGARCATGGKALCEHCSDLNE